MMASGLARSAQAHEPAQNMGRFVAGMTPPAGEPRPARWFIFKGDDLLMRSNGEAAEVPLMADLSDVGITPIRQHYFGYLENERLEQTDCCGAEIAPGTPLPDGMVADGLRQLYPNLGDLMFSLAGRAIQIVTWDRTHQFCGQCGKPTESLAHERAKRCPACGLTSYPRLSPATIIAVVRHTDEGHRLLLARNHRFPPGRFSVIAGYVDPGETLEECARREVCEEVGIQIKNIRYFGSQPWPFPNSLMIGFTAEYAGGEIMLEEKEIAEAGWFAVDSLPGMPLKMSIARRLIDWFAAGGPNANSVTE
jgi:NAD+ diphosphatase